MDQTLTKTESDLPDSNQRPKDFYLEYQLQSSALPTELSSIKSCSCSLDSITLSASKLKFQFTFVVKSHFTLFRFQNLYKYMTQKRNCVKDFVSSIRKTSALHLMQLYSDS
ncbi:hypothetical protein GYH30_052705 [Glycine max]|uniref:Uncharacterized protein n=1 Tax=Glycine max TaxID=3847 RepID=A0A0R0EKH9_SOYBN|nr:hypothetical protein GYH30_052705 [Glycine max]